MALVSVTRHATVAFWSFSLGTCCNGPVSLLGGKARSGKLMQLVSDGRQTSISYLEPSSEQHTANVK